MEKMRTPEEARITIKKAAFSDLACLEDFLGKTQIDSMFTPPLSDPTRNISIKDRVQKKFTNGIWIIAKDEGQKIIGCMAVVPSEINRSLNNTGVFNQNMGVDTSGWSVKKVMELSTVVTDPKVKTSLRVKGVGESMLDEAVKFVANQERCGLITDSWVGGDMDGFITHVLNKKTQKNLDYLVQIYKDVSKRGAAGPFTTVYLIPTSKSDVEYLEKKQGEIQKLRMFYNKILR